MEIPHEDQVITILGDQSMAKQYCQLVVKPQLEAFPLTSLETEKQRANPKPDDQVQTLQIAEEKTIRIGGELNEDIRNGISEVLIKYSDNFASKATEIVGVGPRIASNSLNINLGMKPVILKKRKFAYERQSDF